MAMTFLFSSSSHSYFFLLHATFLYQAIWQHPSALALLICSSAFWLTFFLQDFLPEFILGLYIHLLQMVSSLRFFDQNFAYILIFEPSYSSWF